MVYQHYKGGTYRVLLEGMSSDDLTPMTVYVSLTTGAIWIRSSSEFNGLTESGHKRFTVVR